MHVIDNVLSRKTVFFSNKWKNLLVITGIKICNSEVENVHPIVL